MPTTENPSEKIDSPVKAQEKPIADIAHMGQPAQILHNRVELVAVGDQKPPPVHRQVNGPSLNVHIRIVSGEVGNPLIMISGNIDDFGALTSLSQDFLDHVAVFLSPEDTTLHCPDVYQVTDDIKCLAVERP